jgi:hypothetical protein
MKRLEHLIFFLLFSLFIFIFLFYFGKLGMMGNLAGGTWGEGARGVWNIYLIELPKYWIKMQELSLNT